MLSDMYYSNTLSKILKLIPSRKEIVDLNLIQKLIDWNEEIEKEFIEQPKIPQKQQEDDPIFPLTQLSPNIQNIVLEQIQNQNPSVYCRRMENTSSDTKWKDLAMTNASDCDALAQSIALCIFSSTPFHSSDNNNSIIDQVLLDQMIISHLEWISQLIRASKNIIRYNRILLSIHKGQPKASMNDTFFGLDSTSALCSQGMIQLYMSILSANTRCESTDSTSADCTVRDELARHSATILFHATFAHAEEPCCKTAMRVLQSRDVNGPGIMAYLILQPNSVHVMLSLMKNVHNMISAYPVGISEMDETLHKYQYDGNIGNCKLNVLTILISTLSWCINSPDFPGPMDDRRSDLAIEIIRIIFAIRGVLGKNRVNEMEAENKEIMTALGILIVKILHLSNRDTRVYQCKLSTLMLLMDAPVELSDFLKTHHVIEELILIFWYQLNEFVVEKAGTMASEKNSTSMLPILIVLDKLCKNDPNILKQVKANVFPPEAEEDFLAKVEQKGPEKNMHPLDAPLGSTRQKLISLLTHTETNLKRCCGELLWTLCGNDSKEFILRCGFGNAVHQLGVKGMYALPK
jgi:hypothetical protein